MLQKSFSLRLRIIPRRKTPHSHAILAYSCGFFCCCAVKFRELLSATAVRRRTSATIVWQLASPDHVSVFQELMLSTTLAVHIRLFQLGRGRRRGGGTWTTHNFGWVGHNAFGPPTNGPACSLVVAP